MSTRDRQRRRRREIDRKDRLIQARVDEDLEQALKREAARRHLTVSHLIRNTLEDAFTLVEDVTADVGQLVSGSVELAAAVSRDARRLASLVKGEAPPRDGITGERAPAPPPESKPQGILDRVYGWNRAIANRAAVCGQCGVTIERGQDALVGLTDEPGPRIWLCEGCGEAL
jgi:hypothetical protein